jgi:hypothetical protein
VDVTVEHDPKHFFPQLGLDTVQALVLVNAMQTQHASQLDRLHLSHAAAISLAGLKEGDRDQVGTRPFPQADTVKVVWAPCTLIDIETFIDHVSPRLKPQTVRAC